MGGRASSKERGLTLAAVAKALKVRPRHVQYMVQLDFVQPEHDTPTKQGATFTYRLPDFITLYIYLKVLTHLANADKPAYANAILFSRDPVVQVKMHDYCTLTFNRTAIVQAAERLYLTALPTEAK